MRIILILSILVLGCTPKVTEEELHHLNGYWEIERVTFSDGKTKDFMTNTTIDYIELKGMKGFRKKMQPKFNGTFETSNDAELFTIIQKEDRFIMTYQNTENTWEEKIMALDKDKFTVTNSDSLQYSYKRYQAIKLAD